LQLSSSTAPPRRMMRWVISWLAAPWKRSITWGGGPLPCCARMSRLRKKKGLKVRRCVETPLVPRAGSSRRVVSRRPCRREARTTSAPRKTETPDVGYGEIDRKTVHVSPTRAGNRARSVRASAVRVSHRVHALDFALGQPELRLLGAGAHDARGTTGLPGGDLERRGVSNWWHRVSCAMRLSRVQVRETRTWRPCDRRPGAATARARGGETLRWKTPLSFLCALARDTNASPPRARLRLREI
jgi:hypothetical protein